jgi:two-component system, NtrC family, sensor kinase
LRITPLSQPARHQWYNQEHFWFENNQSGRTLMPNPFHPVPHLDISIRGEDYYRELQRKNLLRLVLMYLAPLFLLSGYFYLQYRSMMQESIGNHLRTVAESRAGTMDLFLHERIVNLSNLIDDSRLLIPPAPAVMEEMLRKLRQANDSFEDVGFIDAVGIQTAYAGPYPRLQGSDYGREEWFVSLKAMSGNFIVSDSHLGFRGKPHFTLAVSRVIEGRYCVLRAALDPVKSYLVVSSLEEAHDMNISVVNQAGELQLPLQAGGTDPRRPPIIPVRSPRIGLATTQAGGRTVPYAYSWLRMCDWALLVVPSADAGSARSGNAQISIIAFSIAIISLVFSVFLIRAKRIVQTIRQADATRAQLTDNLIHASKLAAAGQLAAGIAHEINNPLAIISEEVGLIQDMTDSKFGVDMTLQDLTPHLESIHEAVVRCRGITGKLLAFVRKDEVTVRPHNLHHVIDDVVNNFYGRGIAGAGIKIVRSYCRDSLYFVADRTQLEQVFLNLINNAIDAVQRNGQITITTTLLWEDDRVRVDVEDTGIGMTQEQLEKIFLPFYTTKKVGKGTGLGLAISYAMIKSMEGEISVSSTLGKGSIFSITLPIEGPKKERGTGKDALQERDHDQQDAAPTR